MSNLTLKNGNIGEGKRRKQVGKSKENEPPNGGINGSNSDGRLICHDLIAIKGDLHYKLSSDAYQNNIFITFMEVEINNEMNINIDERDTYWLAFAGVRVPLVWYMQLSPKLEKTVDLDYTITLSTKQSEFDSKFITLNYKDNYSKYMKWYQLFTDAICDLLFRYGLQSISLKKFNPPLYCIWESFPMVTDGNNNVVCNCCHKIGIDRLNTVAYYASKLLSDDHSQLMLVKRIQSFKVRLQLLLKRIDDAVEINQNCKEMLTPCKNLVNEVDEHFKLSELLATDCDLQLLKNYYFYLQTLDSPIKTSHIAVGSPQTYAPKTPLSKKMATPGAVNKSSIKRTVQFAKSPLGIVRASSSKKSNINDNELIIVTEEVAQQPEAEVETPKFSISPPHHTLMTSPYHIITPSPPSAGSIGIEYNLVPSVPRTPSSVEINDAIFIEPVIYTVTASNITASVDNINSLCTIENNIMVEPDSLVEPYTLVEPDTTMESVVTIATADNANTSCTIENNSRICTFKNVAATTMFKSIKFILMTLALIAICINVPCHLIYQHKLSEVMNNKDNFAFYRHNKELIDTRNKYINQPQAIEIKSRSFTSFIDQDAMDNIEISSQDKYLAASINQLFKKYRRIS